MPETEIECLVDGLSDSLDELETCCRSGVWHWLQPILRRRRRAVSALRHWMAARPRRVARPNLPRGDDATLGALMRREEALIGAYDAALARVPSGAERAELRAQRAEAEQALLEIAAVAAARRQPPATGSTGGSLAAAGLR